MSEGILPSEVEEKIIELADGFCDNPNVGDIQDELITFYNESVAAEREAREKAEARLIPHSQARANTQGMAEALYDRMSEFVGGDHRGHCVDILKLALDSFEDNAESLRAQVQELDADVQKYREWIACRVNIKECSLRKGMWTWPFHAIRYNTRDEAIDAAIASQAPDPSPDAQ